jgi:hypothetical protein
LLREPDRAIRLIERLAACFSDARDQGQLIQELPTLVGQRIVAIARGYEDVNEATAYSSIRRRRQREADFSGLHSTTPNEIPNEHRLGD